MQEKTMEIVRRICGTKATNCRSLNKAGDARELLNLANVPDYAKIHEIPLDWNEQVVILFTVDETDKNYYSLFAGIGNDGNFYFELTITGTWSDGYDGRIYFDYYEKEVELPIDWFIQRSPDTPKKGRHTSEAYEHDNDREWAENALAEGEGLLADVAEAEINADEVIITREEKTLLLRLIEELMHDGSDKLVHFVGSVGAEKVGQLHDKLYFYDWCKENGIRYEDMTEDDLERFISEEG